MHDKKRNKLGAARAADLVYVYTNMKLAHKWREPEKIADWVGIETADQEEGPTEGVREGYESASDEELESDDEEGSDVPSHLSDEEDSSSSSDEE